MPDRFDVLIVSRGQTRYGCEIVAEQVDFLAKANEATKDEPKKRTAK